jgi:3-methyladenine DNA glycosylase AlkD
MQLYGYSLAELESMIPWERRIYVAMLNAFIKEENIKLQQAKAMRGQ